MQKLKEKIQQFNNKHTKRRAYSFNANYYNDFLDGTHAEEPFEAVKGLFDYGFMQGREYWNGKPQTRTD